MTTGSGPSGARARAHANIALAKYWGKADAASNLPAAPSVSVTLGALTTTTQVRFDERLQGDQLWINAQPAQPEALARVSRLLDTIRSLAGIKTPCAVHSVNDFPTASGLASSASAFAALALAAQKAAGLDDDRQRASDLARRASASAARSVFGGFVKLSTAAPGQSFLCACPIAPAEHWDLRVIVAVVTDSPKTVASTHGMQHTAATSPFYSSWLQLSHLLAQRVEQAILNRDLQALGEAAEQSALAMHGCAMASNPPLVYFEPATLAAVHAATQLRRAGHPAWATIDAGPHVKVLTTPEHADPVRRALDQLPGVQRTIVSSVGSDPEVELLTEAP
jgi:diphosphomevalonate decarboxylase